MNISQLHAYLGDLLQAGTPGTLPVVLPGLNAGANPNEVSEAMILDGVYDADPAPLAVGAYARTERFLLLAGTLFDMDALEASHKPQWPPVEPPSPERS